MLQSRYLLPIQQKYYIYFRVIQEGNVQTGDEFLLELRNKNALSVQEISQLVFMKKDKVNSEMARAAIFDSNLSDSTRRDIQRRWKL